MPSADHAVLHINVADVNELHVRLNAAVEVLRAKAADSRKGILVTRHEPGRYSLTLTDTVPYGLTLERYA